MTTQVTFGRYVLDASTGVVLAGGAPVGLGGRAMLLLAELLRRRGEVVTKLELMDAAWPDVMVEEANLSVQISQLRRTLGAAPGGGPWIETVPRVGYRFVPEEAPAVSEGPVVAVLPFGDLSEGGDGQRLADGVVEDVTTALAQFTSINVIARTSSFVYRDYPVDVRDVARQLGASYVLEGSVRREGGRVRTTAQLIDGASGAHVWADNFDAHAGERPASRDKLAKSVASAVQSEIEVSEIARSRRARPKSMAAYDLHLRALYLLQSSAPDDNAEAHQLMQRALQLEPDNVGFLATACQVLHHRISVGWRRFGPNDVDESVELARRGIRLASGDAVALSLFSNTMLVAREYELGRALLRQALEINETNSMVLTCAGLSSIWSADLDAAEMYYTRALRRGMRDPNIRFALSGVSAVHRRRGNFEESLRWAKLALAVNPYFAGTHWNLIGSSAYLGRLDDAERYLRNYRAVAPEVTIANVMAGQAIEDPAHMRPLVEGLRLGGMAEA